MSATKTDLLDRYLNAVKFWLPKPQQHDIIAELAEAQGEAVDIGGYYRLDDEKTTAVMRPSKTFNAALSAARN